MATASCGSGASSTLPGQASQASTATTSSLKRLSEDVHMRPFLSSLFDSQAYIRNIIKEGKSEDCFNNIVCSIDDINVEIKGYISMHKEGLMSGMQDVAALADRYTSLSSTSQKLHRNIERLKKETGESHALVAARTTELERIHSASSLLQLLRRFVTAKAQLDEYLANDKDTDSRSLSNAAKTISDLESLLQNPKLLEIKCVNDSVTHIKLFGKNIRMLAQDRLLSAVCDKNQAAIASSLQVFYNLDSLAEVLLLVIDATVKHTVDASRAALDIESINALLYDFQLQVQSGAAGGAVGANSAFSAVPPSALPSSTSGNGSGGGNTSGGNGGTADGNFPTAAASVVSTPLKRAQQTLSMAASSSAAAAAAAAAKGYGNGPVSTAQLRLAIQETAHLWSSSVHDLALRVHVLQRVVAKKEDPTTHERFLVALRRIAHKPSPHSSSSSASSSKQHTQQNTHHTTSTVATAAAGGSGDDFLLPLLTSGQLLELYWRRLGQALQEVATEKLKEFPAACSRAYPHLRRAAVEVVQNLQLWSERDKIRELRTGAIFPLTDVAAGGCGGGVGGMRAYMHAESEAVMGDVDMLGLDDDFDLDNNDAGAEIGAGDAGADIDATGFGGSSGGLSIIGAGGGNSGAGAVGSAVALGMFGSLCWGKDDLLGTHGRHYYSPAAAAGRAGTRNQYQHGITAKASSLSSSSSRKQSQTPTTRYGQLPGDAQPQPQAQEVGLVQGLKPLRDKFLISALSRMSAPILQMFPELEGYTAAIPSRRDLQALVKAIHSEFLTALVEGDAGLVAQLAREFHKTVSLMLSKIEGMVLHTSEARKLSTPQQKFARTHAQEHNAQLFTLLMQLKEELRRIPAAVLTAAEEAGSNALNSASSASATKPRSHVGGGGSSSRGAIVSADSLKEGTGSSSGRLAASAEVLRRAVAVTALWIDELAERQILFGIVELLSGHVRSVLLTLPHEGVVGCSGSSSSSKGSASTSLLHDPASTTECSAAVQTLLVQVPVLVRAHLQNLQSMSLPHGGSGGGLGVLETAIEEFCLRTMHAYVTVAALVRPVSEASRLRTAKDLGAVEAMLSAIHTIQEPHLCPVVREFRAFRRLLFQSEGDVQGKGTGTGTQSDDANSGRDAQGPPDTRRWADLEYMRHLRPSTVLGYLCACAPPQLPAPFEVPADQTPRTGAGAGSSVDSGVGMDGSMTLQGYVLMLSTTLPRSAPGSSSAVHRDGGTGGGAGGGSGGAAGGGAWSGAGGGDRTMIYSVRGLYLHTRAGAGAATGTASSAVDYNNDYAGGGGGGGGDDDGIAVAGLFNWRRVECERRTWQLVQRGLDLLFQRINSSTSSSSSLSATAEAAAAHKQLMRAWYEAIMDFGSRCFR